MALLKQINLIQKSSNEDSLAATYNGCAETSFIDSGNIYEFIFQDENLIGNNGNQLLLAFQLKHSKDLMGFELAKFIFNNMVIKKQPCISFNTDVKINCYKLLTRQSSEISVDNIENLQQDINWSYASPILGNIDYIETQISYRDRIQLYFDSQLTDFKISSTGSDFSCLIKSSMNRTDINKVYCKDNLEDKENTIKYNAENNSKYISVQLSGITTPMYSNNPSSVESYNVNMYLLRTYEYVKKSINTSYISDAITVASYIQHNRYSSILNKQSKTNFIVPTRSSIGVVGNNSKKKLEGIYFISILWKQGEESHNLIINVNKSLLRSSYLLDKSQNYYLPFAVNKLTKMDSDKSDIVYSGGDINSIFLSSVSSLQTLHDNYKKETIAFKGTLPTDTEKQEETASDIAVEDILPIYDTNGNIIKEATNINEGLRNFATRVKDLGYIIKMHEGEYYIVPNVLIINVPSVDGKITTNSTWGDILKTYNISKEAFCGANRINIYKYSDDEKCILGQTFRIPVSNPDKITISDEQMVANYSGYNKLPNSTYVPAESGTSTYEDLTIDDRDKLDNIVREKDENGNDTNKVKWSSFGRFLVRIGDCTLPISPQQIRVKNVSGSESVQSMRSRTALKIKSGYSQEVVELSLTFVGAAQINGSPYQPYEDDSSLIYFRNGLRPLLAQFMKAPFLPIENELLNEEFSIYNVCLQNITIDTLEGYPNGIAATLTLLPFDHTAYLDGEEFFEGAFCWPLFRWYYQQKMIGDTYTKLDLFDINHHVDSTILTDEKGTTKTIYYDPAKVLTVSIPQEMFLKKRKDAIYQLYKKKAPNLFEDTSLNWKKLTDDEKDNVMLNYAHNQFVSFQTFKNSHPKDDYPELYDENGSFTLSKIATVAEEMKNEDFGGFQDWELSKKIKMVCYLADFINCYITTYQQMSILGFIINGLTKDLIANSFNLMKKDMEKLYFSGEEENDYYELTEGSVEPFKPTLEVYRSNIDIIKYYQTVFTQKADENSLATTIGLTSGIVGASAITGGSALIFAASFIASTFLGSLVIVAGLAAIGAAAIINFANDTDDSDWIDKFTICDYKEIDDWKDTINNYGGEIALQLNSEQSVQKYIDGGSCQKDGDTYYLLPNALMTDLGSIANNDQAKEEYKSYIENLQYLAHQTEQDIPMETYTLPEMYITKASCSMTNSFAPLQLEKQSTPVYQYMGGSEVILTLVCKTKSRENVAKLWELIKKTQYFAREYKIAITSGIMKIDHPFLKLMGVKEVLLENIEVETDRDSAEGLNVILTISSFDKTQKNREELTSDGFGVAFESVDQWKLYTRQKRAGTGFDYGNIDFALKEAELYPDLELPTYKEVNDFLARHPIVDRFGVVFDRYENITNCKYVDPDFYIRCEETLRDFVENALINGPSNSTVMYDQYNNAYIDTIPSNEEQMATVNENGEVQAGASSDGPNITVNDTYKTNFENSITRMKELDQIALYGELPGSILYELNKNNPVEDTKMTEEEKAESLSNYNSVKDVLNKVLDLNADSYTEEYVNGHKEKVTKKTHIDGATWLNINQQEISALCEYLETAAGTDKKDIKQKLKIIKSYNKNAELSIRCFDYYDYLGSFDPNGVGGIYHYNFFNAFEFKKAYLSNNSKRILNDGNKEGSYSAAFIGIYFLLYLLSEENITNLNALDAKDWYIIIDQPHPSNIFSRFNYSVSLKSEYITADENGKYPWHPCSLIQDLGKISTDKISITDLLNGSKYNYRELFESHGVYIYKRGHESNQSVAATKKLLDFDKYKSILNIEDKNIQSSVSSEILKDELNSKAIARDIFTTLVSLIKNKKINLDLKDIKSKIDGKRNYSVKGACFPISSIPNMSTADGYKELDSLILITYGSFDRIEESDGMEEIGMIINPNKEEPLVWNDTKRNRLAHLYHWFLYLELVEANSFIIINNEQLKLLGSKEVNHLFSKHNYFYNKTKDSTGEDITSKEIRQVYNILTKNGVLFVNEYKNSLTVSGDQNTLLATKREGSLASLTDSISSMGLENALEAATQNKLFRSSFADMLRYDHRGRLVRAFPTFHMFIVDEGEENVFWSMWDNFYGYNSLVSIDLYKDRRIIADTLKVQMTNIYHNLSSIDNELDYSKDKYSFFDAFSNKEYWKDAVNTLFNLPDLDLLQLKQNKINTMLLQPGARIHLRMGYGSDAYNLPVVFNGTITEANTGELVEFIAQGDGVELTNKLHAKTKDTTDKSCLEMPMAPRQIIGNMMTGRGSFFSNIINDVTNNTFKSKNPLGIAHFGNKGEIPKITAWQQAPIFFGWWSRITSVESETNNFGPSLLNVYGGGQARSMSSWSYTDLNSKSTDFSGNHLNSKWNPLADKTNVNQLPRVRLYLFDMTTNDVCQMLAASCPDYICAVAPFELRSTLFFGRPHWGCATEYINTYVYNQTYNQCEKRSVGYIRHSFSQSRIYTSYTDIIANDITTSTTTMKTNMIGYYNEKDGAKQTAVVQIDSDLDDDCQTTGIVHLPIKADWGPANLLGYNYVHQGKYAEIAATSELKNLIGTMYDGELITIADPSAKPHDLVYIEDSYKDMCGAFNIRSVHHSMSIDGGFVSSITPDLISVYDDEQFINSINWKLSICSFGVTAIANRFMNSIGWQAFMRGPIGHRIKQAGWQGVETVYRKIFSAYCEDGNVSNLIDLVPDNISDSLQSAFSADEAAEAYAKWSSSAVDAVEDRVKITTVMQQHQFKNDKEMLDFIKEGKLQEELGSKTLKTINLDDLDAKEISKYIMNDQEFTKFSNLKTGLAELDPDTLKGIKELKLVDTEIDDWVNLIKKADKETLSLSKSKINRMNELIEGVAKVSDQTEMPENIKALQKILQESGGKKTTIKANELNDALDSLKKLNTNKHRKVLDELTDLDSKRCAAILDKMKESLQKGCTNYNSKFLNSAVNKIDNLSSAIENRTLMSTAKSKVSDLFSKKTLTEALEEIEKSGTRKMTDEAVESLIKAQTKEYASKFGANITDDIIEGIVKKGISEAGEEATEEVIKNTIKKSITEVASQAGEEVAKKVTQEALEQALQEGAEKTVKEIGELGIKTATVKVLKSTSSKTLTQSLKTLMHAAKLALGPYAWIGEIAVGIAIDMLINTAFEAYTRWKRRRQALILMPMQFQHNTFVVGLDGHKGCVLGDQPSKTDLIIMGQTGWGVPFKIMNAISGSDYDYSHKSLADVYNDWKDEVNAWG